MATVPFPIGIRIPQRNFTNGWANILGIPSLAAVPTGAIIPFEVGGNNSRNFRTMLDISRSLADDVQLGKMIVERTGSEKLEFSDGLPHPLSRCPARVPFRV